MQLSTGNLFLDILCFTFTTSIKCADFEQSIPFHCRSLIMIVNMSNIRNTSGSYLLPSLNAPFPFIAPILLIDSYVLEGTFIICDTFPVTWELKYLFLSVHDQTYVASSLHFWAFSSLPNVMLSPLWSGWKVSTKNTVCRTHYSFPTVFYSGNVFHIPGMQPCSFSP